MKYGLLINEHNSNLGDDIQAYAEARFLPRVDILVNREHLDSFSYGDGTEPVALIMGAWFMWSKFNWPPSRQIFPLNVGYHHYNRNPKLQKSSKYAVPIFEEMYSGVGGQWFKDAGPVGCRDEFTCKVMEKAGIPHYFSGCTTLTLPKQKETPDKDTYIVCVDLNVDVEKKVRDLVGDRYEVRTTTHQTPNIHGASWEERVARVEEYLTLYQNAKYVVTRRLHVALPCLAMGVPVMVIQSVRMNDPNRFEPYNKWLHYCRNHVFLREGYPDFDFQNGTPNKPDYLEYRASLEKTLTEFADFCKAHDHDTVDDISKISYTDAERDAWSSEYLKAAFAATHKESKKLFSSYQQQSMKLDDMREKLKALQAENAAFKAKFSYRVKRKLKRMFASSEKNKALQGRCLGKCLRPMPATHVSSSKQALAGTATNKRLRARQQTSTRGHKHEPNK